MQEIISLAALQLRVGQKLAVSDWLDVTQEQIARFAQVTGDLQWIHLDADRCRTESPFAAPVAHGFLTLSLLPVMMNQALAFSDARLSLNYGLNRVRFPAPLPARSRIRAHVALLGTEDIAGGVQLTWDVLVERQGHGKPVCIAEYVTRHYG